MAPRLAKQLLLFAALILLETKLRSTAEVVAMPLQDENSGGDEEKLKILQETFDKLSEELPIARLSVSPTAKLLVDYSQFENSREKLALNELYAKLHDETHSGLGRMLQAPERKAQDFWQKFGEEQAKLAKGDQSELVQGIWTELRPTQWPEADQDYKLGLHSELLVKMMDLVKEYMLASPTTSGEQTVAWCQAKEHALNINSLLELFSFDRQGKLFTSLQTRALDLFELCKPIWDEQFIELIDTRLNQTQRELMSQLFDNVVSASGLFRMDNGKQPESINGFDFITLALFRQFISRPPEPASVLHFLLRHFEDQFKLDDNMKNRHLTMDTYKQAVDGVLKPLCKEVCKQLSEPNQFYMNIIYDNELLDQKEAYLRLFLGSSDPEQGGLNSIGGSSKKVNMWAASTAICCLISNSKVAKQLHTKIFNDITRSGSAYGDHLDESHGKDDELLAAIGGDYTNEFARIDEEFVRKRRERFLKESGFKRPARNLATKNLIQMIIDPISMK